MLKGFKEFILRGNVIDLAVAVVIGAAFTALINGLVAAVFNPAIGALFNVKSLDELLIVTVPTTDGSEAQIKFGVVIAALIQFLLVALIVYFALIVPINYLKRLSFAKKLAGEEITDVPPTEIELLTEIRDLLAAQPEHHGKHDDVVPPPV